MAHTQTRLELEITKFIVDYEIPGHGSTSSEHWNSFYFVIAVDSSTAVKCPVQSVCTGEGESGSSLSTEVNR